jgi:hypothetical protein
LGWRRRDRIGGKQGGGEDVDADETESCRAGAERSGVALIEYNTVEKQREKAEEKTGRSSIGKQGACDNPYVPYQIFSTSKHVVLLFSLWSLFTPFLRRL